MEVLQNNFKAQPFSKTTKGTKVRANYLLF